MDPDAMSPAANVKGDASLVARAQSGDETAWTAIVELHWKQVWSLSRIIVRDRHGAEEVAQETFRAVKDKLAAYQGEGTLCGWIQSICRHQALDELRRRSRHAREVSIGDTPGLEARAVSGEQRRVEHVDLENALAALDDEERDALLLTEAGYTSDELANALGVAARTIRSRRARARTRLLQLLGGGGRLG
jgi:RNA polymerase sigma-70 factor, ECF subfamily